MKNIIIIGARGYEKDYGGWETFVTNLINNYDDKDTKFYVPELNHNKKYYLLHYLGFYSYLLFFYFFHP